MKKSKSNPLRRRREGRLVRSIWALCMVLAMFGEAY